MLDGLRGKDSIAQSLYYKWSRDFMEAGKKRLVGDIMPRQFFSLFRWVSAAANAAKTRQDRDLVL